MYIQCFRTKSICLKPIVVSESRLTHRIVCEHLVYSQLNVPVGLQIIKIWENILLDAVIIIRPDMHAQTHRQSTTYQTYVKHLLTFVNHLSNMCQQYVKHLSASCET